MSWYRDWFDAEQYELVYRDRDVADAERLAQLIEASVEPRPEELILDVGTGRGRHALVLAARGHRVVGLDLAPRAIDRASRRASEAGLSHMARFVEGDMRSIPFADAEFDGVVNLFTSFGYFDDELDHGRAIGEMARVLRPGGWLFQDFLNPGYLRAHLVPSDERLVDGIRVRQARRVVEDAPGGPRVVKSISIERSGAAPAVFEESVRLLELDDFERMYAGAGLRIVSEYGDYGGAAAAPDRPRLILHAVKPGEG